MVRSKRRTAFYTARRNRGLTQVELSRLSGVSQSVISDLESGRNTNPSWDILSRLSQVLGVRPEQLIPPSKIPKGVQPQSRVIGDPLHEAFPV